MGLEMKKLIAIALTACLLSGCAADMQNGPNGVTFNYVPVIDTQGLNPETYNRDLAECNTYASNLAKKAAQAAVAGAIFGALLGAAVAGGRGAAFGAGVGAANGIGYGAVAADQRNRLIVGNCMRGRGYTLLSY